MITPEEREEIINAAVEKALLLLPDTVGSLIANHVSLSKINSQFYKDHPEFKDKKDIVASIIEKIDGENPTMDYKDILGKAVPEIRRRIETVDSLNMKTVSPNPSRAYEPLTVPKIDNRHGEL
jgi:hypothetical protein